MTDPTINIDRLTRIMQAFEQGEYLTPENPFDVESFLDATGIPGDTAAAQTVRAFSKMAVSDTPKIADMTDEEHATALASAGIMQGLWIGYEYAQREVYPTSAD